uniref:Uncharacterized protein n=1 Tax=Oryza sativa subsp. japonica TaxID=39947 RepID=Q6K913_ORYSJ|nr:hypothetical protein [Oryza sativa Japonica Group]
MPPAVVASSSACGLISNAIGRRELTHHQTPICVATGCRKLVRYRPRFMPPPARRAAVQEERTERR